MSRSSNLDVLEMIRTHHRKWRVWMKGTPIAGYDPAVWRYDRVGKIIKYDDHGDRQSEFGWEIDHYPVPVAFGGGDDIYSLWPLNCFDNASLGGGLAGFAARQSGGIGAYVAPASPPTGGIGLVGFRKGGIGGW
jgi:hypothetical protein